MTPFSNSSQIIFPRKIFFKCSISSKFISTTNSVIIPQLFFPNINKGFLLTSFRTISLALKVLNMIRVQSREKGGFTPNVMCLLYSAMVQPILEYSCEVWGVKYFHDIEKVLLKFCKEMLGLPPNASNMAVYGETGTFPQWLRIYYRIIKYFIRIHVNTPPLVSEALTLLKHTLNKRNNWYTAKSEIIMKYTYYLAILPSNVNFLFRVGQYFPILPSYIAQSVLAN